MPFVRPSDIRIRWLAKQMKDPRILIGPIPYLLHRRSLALPWQVLPYPAFKILHLVRFQKYHNPSISNLIDHDNDQCMKRLLVISNNRRILMRAGESIFESGERGTPAEQATRRKIYRPINYVNNLYSIRVTCKGIILFWCKRLKESSTYPSISREISCMPTTSSSFIVYNMRQGSLSVGFSVRSFFRLSACRRYLRLSPSSATAIGTLPILSSAAIPIDLQSSVPPLAQPFATIHFSSFLPQANPLFMPILLPFLK